MTERAEAGDKFGRLIATSSLASLFGTARNEHYAGTKAALNALCRALAVELARYGVTANAILSPGWIKSDMTANIMANDKFVANVMPRIPVRRFGELADFGGIAVYLMSKASSYHTADCFVIDGGYTAFWSLSSRPICAIAHQEPGRRGKYLPPGGKTDGWIACAKAGRAFTVAARNKRFDRSPEPAGPTICAKWENRMKHVYIPRTTTYGLNPEEELNDLRMSEQVRPLYDHVKKFIRETVDPMSVEFYRHGEKKTDRWSFTPEQLEVLGKAKAKAKEEGSGTSSCPMTRPAPA